MQTFEQTDLAHQFGLCIRLGRCVAVRRQELGQRREQLLRRLLRDPVAGTMLKRANARVGKVESAAEKSLSSNATPARLRTLILAWANTETQLGRSFRAIQAPATAASGNALLARGEITFGAELAHAANNLPRKKAAIGAYLQRTLGNATGAAMIDHALKKLKLAGYGASV